MSEPKQTYQSESHIPDEPPGDTTKVYHLGRYETQGLADEERQEIRAQRYRDWITFYVAKLPPYSPCWQKDEEDAWWQALHTLERLGSMQYEASLKV